MNDLVLYAFFYITLAWFIYAALQFSGKSTVFIIGLNVISSAVVYTSGMATSIAGILFGPPLFWGGLTLFILLVWQAACGDYFNFLGSDFLNDSYHRPWYQYDPRPMNFQHNETYYQALNEERRKQREAWAKLEQMTREAKKANARQKVES